MSPEREAIAVVWRHKRFWLLHAAALAALAAGAVSWFWISDASAVAVVLSFAGGLALVAAMAWLLGATLLFYRRAYQGGDARIAPAMRDALRRIPALLICVLLLIAVFFPPSSKTAWRIAWQVVLPAMVLPLAASVTAEGFRGFFRKVWKARFLAAYVVLAAAAGAIAYGLVRWRPPVGGVAMQTVSLSIRLLIAYSVAVSAWLMIACLASRSVTAGHSVNASSGITEPRP